MCWAAGRNNRGDEFGVLNCNEAPSKDQIDAYQAWLVEAKDTGGGGEE